MLRFKTSSTGPRTMLKEERSKTRTLTSPLAGRGGGEKEEEEEEGRKEEKKKKPCTLQARGESSNNAISPK